jgi:superoxide dismutase, Cu-Zn family
MRYYKWIAFAASFWVMVAGADTTQITIYKLIPNSSANQVKLGTVTATDTQYGLLFTPELELLTPGIHGMHVHENPSCADGGLAAGGHLDPMHTGKHLGPYNNAGHLGDLPALTVTADGKASLPVLAPRLKVADLKGHSLIIHAGGDNYSDTPPMGGGGARMACGVISQ